MRSKCIVLVGPECAGKSTQISKLYDEYGAKIVKHIRIPGDFQKMASVINDIQQQQIRTSVVGSERLVIFDRWQLVDDVIYEKYCYDKTSVFESLLELFGVECKEANIQIVYMHLDELIMTERMALRGDKLRTLEEAITTNKAYETFYADYKDVLPIKRLDVTRLTEDDVFDLITAIIEEEDV